MTLNEWLMLDPAHQCDVPTCDFGSTPYPVGEYAIRLCRPHQRECDHRGREGFELRYGLDLGQIASGYGEAFRQFYHAEVRRLREELA